MSTRDRLLSTHQELKSFARGDGSAKVLIFSRDVDGVPTPALLIRRQSADGKQIAGIAFHREELRELREVIEQARRLLLGADEASDDARAQLAAGLRPSKPRRRR